MELGFSEPRFSHLRDGCWQPDEEASRLRLHHLEKPRLPPSPTPSPSLPSSLSGHCSVRTPSTASPGLVTEAGAGPGLSGTFVRSDRPSL